MPGPAPTNWSSSAGWRPASSALSASARSGALTMACAAAAESAGAAAEVDSGAGALWAQPARERQAARMSLRMAPPYSPARALALRFPLSWIRRLFLQAEHRVEVHHVGAVVRIEIRRLLEERHRLG